MVAIDGYGQPVFYTVAQTEWRNDIWHIAFFAMQTKAKRDV
jgi:hypothetical protein